MKILFDKENDAGNYKGNEQEKEQIVRKVKMVNDTDMSKAEHTKSEEPFLNPRWQGFLRG